MPKEEWGTKRLCPHCATRFYDLQNDPMSCPACGAQFTLESLNDGRSKSYVSEKASSSKLNDLVEDDEDLDEDNSDLDDDLLDEDDDDGDVSLDDIADVAENDDE
jgi:uncharacterized Zn finger protein (UPF0148 family)